jgi:peptidyl-tRNA hydrolase, PTH1 family
MEGAAIRLVVGLGNPGKEYQETRHNLGFMVLDAWRQTLPGLRDQNARHHADSLIWHGRYAGRALWLQQPLTFMNLSGKAVSQLVREENLLPSEILIIYDDLDLPFGRMRFRAKGSSGGHRGVESIITHLASNAFARMRLGIGKTASSDATIDHVLSPFSPVEQTHLPTLITTAREALQLCLRRGLVAAMNHFNTYDLLAEPGPPIPPQEPIP